MTEKELAVNIYNFLKMNPKRIQIPKINKRNANSFLVIQEIYKILNNNINITTYDDIFWNTKTKLPGNQWLAIFLNCDNIVDYHNKLRINYPKIDSKRFKEKVSYECFSWFYNNKQKNIIQSSEVSLNIDIKKQLDQVRKFLDQQNWSNYFFNLQRIMHQQLIVFLAWKNKPLNYLAYSKTLQKKLKLFLNEESVIKYINIIQNINSYRNTFSKASSVNSSLEQKFYSAPIAMKKVLAWELYFNLVELLNTFNLLSNYK